MPGAYFVVIEIVSWSYLDATSSKFWITYSSEIIGIALERGALQKSQLGWCSAHHQVDGPQHLRAYSGLVVATTR